jgi:integrase
MAKLPSLEFVKFVKAKGKIYAYFNTGKKNSKGNAIYVRMPHPSSVGFYDSYSALKGARTKRETPSYTIADLARDYGDSTTLAALSDGTQRLYGVTLKRITELLGAFPINDLKREHLQTVLDHDMKGAGAHNAFIAVLGVIYTWARERDKTELEPTRTFKKRRMGEHEAWPENIVEAGLEAEHDRTRLAIALLYFTGQRIGDVMKMRWSDIRGDAVYVVQQKTGKKLRIPLISELQAELNRTPKRGITIITNHEGARMTPQRVRAEIKKFAASMGYHLKPHGLRKNAVIALLEAGCTVAEAASITGQTYAMVEHYARQIDQARLGTAAIIKLENKRGTGKRQAKQVYFASNSEGVK